LPPNYTPPTVVYSFGENINNSAPVLIENQQPQSDYAHVSQPMGETHEVPQDYTLVGFGVYPRYIAEGQTFSGIRVLNTPRISQCWLLSQPLHFVRGEGHSTILEKERIEHMEERLCTIEGGGNYAFANMAELCLVPYVVIPPKFKVPNFDKYKGTTCPKNHLKMYCRKMGEYTKDENLLMHFFQESLAGTTITWYTNLEPSRVHSWKDLMVAFIRQYQDNSDMPLDRMQLQKLCKKDNESFKEYAQRWIDLATQVAPPMMEREIITMIVETLLVFYYEKVVGYMPKVLLIYFLLAKGSK